MIKVQLFYTTKCIIEYNGFLEDRRFAEKCGTLDEVIAAAKKVIINYNFVYANIIDADTGEVLVSLGNFPEKSEVEK